MGLLPSRQPYVRSIHVPSPGYAFGWWGYSYARSGIRATNKACRSVRFVMESADKSRGDVTAPSRLRPSLCVMWEASRGAFVFCWTPTGMDSPAVRRAGWRLGCFHRSSCIRGWLYKVTVIHVKYVHSWGLYPCRLRGQVSARDRLWPGWKQEFGFDKAKVGGWPLSHVCTCSINCGALVLILICYSSARDGP